MIVYGNFEIREGSVHWYNIFTGIAEKEWKKYKKTKLVVDKFTKKIYDIAICSLVYIFAEIKDKGYKVEIKEEVHC